MSQWMFIKSEIHEQKHKCYEQVVLLFIQLSSVLKAR
jgi:hypothetical protein